MFVYLDTEFTYPKRPDLISIALVCEDGREFYAERTDFYPEQCSEFVNDTVLPLLGRVAGAACTRKELTDRLRGWFKQFSEQPTVVFDSEIDWHLLCVAMLGRPHSKPPGDFARPFFLDSSIVTSPVFVQAQSRSYTPEWSKHHALADGRALMAGLEAYQELSPAPAMLRAFEHRDRLLKKD
jgi:hypothetical protein